jgi:hypothetical protein
MAPGQYQFGVEIETIVLPYALATCIEDADWRRQLATQLQNWSLSAVYDKCCAYTSHVQYYSEKWFVTRDSSLNNQSYPKTGEFFPFCRALSP